jgi:Leucine-rich repeat (LRR) protein
VSFPVSIGGGMMWNTTGGQPWNFSTPLNASQPCLSGSARWQGIDCSANNDHITSLLLSDFGMIGTLPVSLCDLFALDVLSFAQNKLYGQVPSCVSRLSALTVMDFKDNALSGPLPDSLWEMTQLLGLNVYNNRITGTLPTGVGNLHQLMILSLAANLMSGELPGELGKLRSVMYAPIGM